MLEAHNGIPNQSQAAAPHAAAESSDLTRVLVGIMLVLVGVGAIVGGIIAYTSGMPALAFAIALVAGAFFARVAC